MQGKMASRGRILDYIRRNKKARVDELRSHLGVSRQLIHHHLKRLIKDNLVIKSGRPPLVFYEIKAKKEKSIAPDVSMASKKYIDSH